MGRRKRENLPKAGTWFVTTTVEDFNPVFSEPEAATITLDLLTRYADRHKVHLMEYVIMPTHVHLLLETKDTGGSVSEFMRDFKKGVSHALIEYWEQNHGLWQSRFDDLLITNEETYRVKAEYIRWNPVKAGLCKSPEEYRFSSAWTDGLKKVSGTQP